MRTLIDVQASYRVLADADGFPAHAGLQMWKTVDDLTRYRIAIEATDPAILIETGTHTGGFAAWVADTFNLHVITIDANPHPARPRHYPGVTFLRGDSTAQATLEAVHGLTGGRRRIMVSLDSDHHQPHVKAEIRAYGPMVSAGCYLVVEDGLADLVGPARAHLFGKDIPILGGPLAAVGACLVGAPGWTRDTAIEAVSPVSHNPGGWWRHTVGGPGDA